MLAAVVLALAAMVGTLLAAPGGGGGGPPPDRGPPTDRGNAFEISGDATETLYPGVWTTLELTVVNPFTFAIVVDSVSVTVGSASPACTAGNVELGDPVVPLEIARDAGGVITVPIGLQIDAVDTCQGATFLISYTATAVRS